MEDFFKFGLFKISKFEIGDAVNYSKKNKYGIQNNNVNQETLKDRF